MSVADRPGLWASSYATWSDRCISEYSMATALAYMILGAGDQSLFHFELMGGEESQIG